MEFVGTFWALVPPIVAIVLALITKETYTSLFVGIVVGALLLAGFDPINTINYIIVGEIGEGEDAMAVGFLNAISDPWNAGIFVFLVMLGIMVALVNKAGGSAAFGAWAAKHIKTRVGAQLALFGHTHRALLEEQDGLWLMNPGACGAGRSDFGEIITDEHGGFTCRLRNAETMEDNDAALN